MIAFKLTDFTSEEIKIVLEEAIKPTREINEQMIESLDKEFSETINELHNTSVYQRRLKIRQALMLIEVQLHNALMLVKNEEKRKQQLR